MSLWLILALVAGALVVFEVWGRGATWMPLGDMRLLNNSIALLVRRGQNGATLRVRWSGSEIGLVLTKRLRTDGGIEIEIATVGRNHRTSVSPLATVVLAMEKADFEVEESAAISGSVRRVRAELERRAESIGLALVPNASLSLRRILAFNVPEATGMTA